MIIQGLCCTRYVYVQRLNLDLDFCFQWPGIRPGHSQAPSWLPFCTSTLKQKGQNARWPGYFGATSALVLAQVSLINKLEQAQLIRSPKNFRECNSRIEAISVI